MFDWAVNTPLAKFFSFYTHELLYLQYLSRVGANTKTSIKHCFDINSLKEKQEKQWKNNQMTFFG